MIMETQNIMALWNQCMKYMYANSVFLIVFCKDEVKVEALHDYELIIVREKAMEITLIANITVRSE